MTQHSILRTKERAKLTSNSAAKFINNAIQFGQDASHFPSKERTYLESKFSDNKKAVYYKGYCFIIADRDVCVTMFPVPSWFGKKSNFDGKIKVRNPKKYFNRYCPLSQLCY